MSFFKRFFSNDEAQEAETKDEKIISGNLLKKIMDNPNEYTLEQLFEMNENDQIVFNPGSSFSHFMNTLRTLSREDPRLAHLAKQKFQKSDTQLIDEDSIGKPNHDEP